MRRAIEICAPYLKQDAPAAVTVLDFESEDEYAKYQTNTYSRAYFSARGNDRTVMVDRLAQDRTLALSHEFFHYAVNAKRLKFPLWFEEGLAEFYSTLDFTNGAVVGRPVAERVVMLRKMDRFQLQAVLMSRASAALSQDPTQAMSFYNVSWAVVHMLQGDAHYAKGFNQFLQAMASGKDAADSFREVYNKELVMVEDDLRVYLNRKALPAGAVPGYEAPAAVALQEAAFDTAELDRRLATVALSLGRAELANTALARAASANPGSVDTLLLKAAAAMKAGNKVEAYQAYKDALQAGATEPRAMRQLAFLAQEQKDTETMLAALKRYVDAQPSDWQVRMVLASNLTSMKRFDDAYAVMKAPPPAPTEMATDFSRRFAIASYYSGHKDDAVAAVQQLEGLGAAQAAAELKRAFRI